MRRLRKFLALPRAERMCVLLAVGAVWTFRLALALLPYRVVDGTSRRVGRRLPFLFPLPAERVSWCARVGGRMLRSARPCLPRALAARLLLAWYGHEAELHLGVKREHGSLLAHAWVTCNGNISIGGGPGSHVPLQRPSREPR
jgi:hypothetical protein